MYHDEVIDDHDVNDGDDDEEEEQKKNMFVFSSLSTTDPLAVTKVSAIIFYHHQKREAKAGPIWLRFKPYLMPAVITFQTFSFNFFCYKNL